MNKLILYGDGIHDDTEALQAFVDGLPVFDPHGNQIERVIEQGRVGSNDFIRMPPGQYRVTRTINLGSLGILLTEEPFGIFFMKAE